MKLFLPSVCIGLVVLLHIFSEGIVFGMARLLTAALVIAAIRFIFRTRM